MTENKSLSQLQSLLSPKTLVVLDIDSTLVLTHKRNQAILHQFAHQIAASEPELSQCLLKSECHAFEYGFYPAVNRAVANLTEEQKQKIHSYWREHFFSGEFLQHDIPHDGALDFVEYLSKKNIPHIYLTGRPKPLMWDGTHEILQKLGFTVNEDILFLKPHPKDVDELFKSEVIGELKKKYSQIVFIDNEPKVLNQIDRDHPEVYLVFVDTCHSPNVFPPAGALKMRDFRELVGRLKA